MLTIKRLTRFLAVFLAVAPSCVFALASARVDDCEMPCCKPAAIQESESPESCCSSKDVITFTSGNDTDGCGCQMDSAPAPDHGAIRVVASSTAPFNLDIDVDSDPTPLQPPSEEVSQSAKIRLPNHDPPVIRLSKEDFGRAPPIVK
ncbi:MAG TPA: hypothetical protein VK171_15985 [Fimbriimonas sp.]|nr:hypothetical protein [Fimbriimonas sp.]